MRTFGLDAVRIEWNSHGICSLATDASCTVAHPSFEARFAASRNVSWFKLIEDEYLTEICLRVSDSNDRIMALCFRTNKRCTQWYGSAEGTPRQLTAPAGFYIHMIHESNQGSVCRNLGAYFVPHSLRVIGPTTCLWVANSAVIGDIPHDTNSVDGCEWPTGTIAAVVISFRQHLVYVDCIHPVAYQRFLAVTTNPLGSGESVLVLMEGELITGLRGCVAENRISAIQFVTSLRTTEWFGPVPDAEAEIETRSISDEPTATHIGGLFMVKGPDHIKSIGVKFYRKAD